MKDDGRPRGKRDHAVDDAPFVDGIVLAREFAPILERARQLGVFVGGRGLLTCPCDLMEDVLIDGRVVVVAPRDSAIDVGGRFVEEGSTGRYRCPGCGAAVSDAENP